MSIRFRRVPARARAMWAPAGPRTIETLSTVAGSFTLGAISGSVADIALLFGFHDGS